MRVCARCGANNPDDAVLCRTCGLPLTDAAGTGPQASERGDLRPRDESDVTSPAGYASPSYLPKAQAPAAPVHRMRRSRVIGAVLMSAVVLAAVGSGIGLLSSRAAVPGSFPNIAGLPPSPSPSATLSPSPSFSPIPGLFPSPNVSPSAPSPAPQTLGPAVSNDGAQLPVPLGWSVNSSGSESIALTSPDGGGSLLVASGPSNPTQSAAADRDAVNRYYASAYPDAAACPGGGATSGTLNGETGLFWTLCFTLTAAGQTYPAAAAMFAGSNSAGSVYYLVVVLTGRDKLQGFVADCEPIVEAIKWRLT
jgi:hypothetical protein